MGCSNDSTVEVDNDNTSHNQDNDDENLTEKDFPDFEEYDSKQLIE
jgi:hypothetical protein